MSVLGKVDLEIVVSQINSSIISWADAFLVGHDLMITITRTDKKLIRKWQWPLHWSGIRYVRLVLNNYNTWSLDK